MRVTQMHLCGIFDLAWMVQHGRLFAQDGGLDKISGGSRSEVVAKLADAPNRYRLVLTLTTSRLKRTNLNRLLKTSSFSPISALSAFWPIRICNSAHSAVCLLSNALSGRTRRQSYPPQRRRQDEIGRAH